MNDNEKLIEALRSELEHASINGHVVSAESQGVALGEIVPAVRVSSIEAVIDRFEKTHTPTDDEREIARLRSALEDVWRVIHRDVRLLANLDPAELGGIVARALDRKAGRSEVQEPSETVLFLDDSLKKLRETLCAVQNGAAGADRMNHSERVGRIIAEIDRQRPLGSNGKHGDRHTATCGCGRSEFALQGYRTLLADLDRNASGRHEGDYDSYATDNGGISAGNPHLTTGQIIGYDIGGREYVVPEPRERGTLSAWVRAAGGVR